MRIVSGTLRGRRLTAPKGRTTRPTSDKVREALFSILHDRTHGARVLDCYAGTGALGLEAISRGAKLAVFVESDRDATHALRQNVAQLGVEDRTHVLTFDAKRLGAPLVDKYGAFDLVLMDPPYDRVDEALLVGRRLAELGAVAPDGLWVLEHADAGPPPEAPPGWHVVRRRGYGKTMLSFFAPGESDGDDEIEIEEATRDHNAQDDDREG
ncbi:16S rRNA (guanine(966)-N(2))-methyltransferase RsmD [bacterium]|nr:16S rRNA (guanine(966)-N(2))-methyltransferase RsmD [bacterium]